MEELSAIRTTEKIDALNARAYELRNNPEPEGQHLADEALALAENENYPKGAAEALLTLGWRNVLKGNFDLTLEQSERALSLATGISDKAVEARACSNIGVMYFSTGDYSKALEYHTGSLHLHEGTGNKQGIANSFNNIGVVYYNTGDYSKALEYHMRSLLLREEIGDKLGTSNSLGNIGNVYFSTGDYSKALENYMRSLGLYEETGDKQGIANSLMNIGLVYFNSGDYGKALKHLMRSLALKEEIGDKHGIAYSHNNIGNVYHNTGNYGKALEHYMRSLLLKEETGDKLGIANSLGNIGRIYTIKEYGGHDSAKAIEHLTRALAIAEEINAKELGFKTHKELAEAYGQMGDGMKAYEHHKEYHKVEKEVHSEESAKKMHNLEQQQKIALMEQEQKATFKILNRVLPGTIVDRVRKGEENIADKFPSASVLFADIVGFTPLAEKLGADEVLKLLSGIFSDFDALCEKFDVEKIKTIGDSYMAASGVPVECDDHLLKIARLALTMQEDIKLNLGFKIPELSIRIGIHTGEVVAGVLGTHKLSYDIWGDTVNTAARMESTGEPDKIHCTEDVFKILKSEFVFKERGEMEIKGKGVMKTYFLIGEKV